MKKITTVGILLVTFSFLWISSIYLLNEFTIRNYKKGNYRHTTFSILYALNFYQSYIDYYNEGNFYYQEGNYEKAKERYEIALTKKPSSKRVCDIRVNLSLSILKMWEKEKTTGLLEEAKQVLYQDDCAHENDNNGKSQEAEQLEEEIKQQQTSQGKEDPSNGGGDDPSNGGNPSDPSKEEEIKQQIKQNTQGRNEELRRQEESNNYEYYPGKKW